MPTVLSLQSPVSIQTRTEESKALGKDVLAFSKRSASHLVWKCAHYEPISKCPHQPCHLCSTNGASILFLGVLRGSHVWLQTLRPHNANWDAEHRLNATLGT